MAVPENKRTPNPADALKAAVAAHQQTAESARKAAADAQAERVRQAATESEE